MLAYDYPLLGAFWTMMIFFLWIIWIFILFRVITDIFRSDDTGRRIESDLAAVRPVPPISRRFRLPHRPRFEDERP